MVTQWLACGTKITPFLKAHWKGFISQHSGGGPETVVFLWSTLFTFSSLYFYFVFLLCLQCENMCSKLTHMWLHPIFQRKCSCFLIKIFSFSAEDEVVSNTEVILRTEDHQPGSYNGKLPHFFPWSSWVFERLTSGKKMWLCGNVFYLEIKHRIMPRLTKLFL